MVLLAGLAAVLVAAGVVGSVRAGDGLVRTTTVVDGVPLTLVRLGSSGPARQPGAVVVHGFAGSARLMQPFADTLARNGYVVALPDLAGHGASTRALVDPMSDVDVAVRFLRARSDVDADHIVLVGHSRGAAAVTAYAGVHDDIAATVALSLGQAPAVQPRNLLMLYGQFEFPVLAAAAQEMLLRPDPTATVTMGYTYGSAADGTARRADPVPGVEHVSILFSATAHERTLTWLDAAVEPGRTQPDVHPVDRLWPAMVLLLGLLVGFLPVTALVFLGTPSGVGSVAPVDLARLALVLAGGLAAGAVAGLVTPDPVLGMAVGGYTAIVLLAFGGATAIGARLVHAPATQAQHNHRWTYLRTALLAVYATAMVAVPIQVGLTWVVPSGPRLGPLVAILAAAWVLFVAAEWLSGGRWYLHAAVLAAPLVLLLALVIVGFGPGFLVLVLPLLGALLAVGAGVAAVLRRWSVAPWLAAAVAAPPFAWTVAATLPLA